MIKHCSGPLRDLENPLHFMRNPDISLLPPHNFERKPRLSLGPASTFPGITTITLLLPAHYGRDTVFC